MLGVIECSGDGGAGDIGAADGVVCGCEWKAVVRNRCGLEFYLAGAAPGPRGDGDLVAGWCLAERGDQIDRAGDLADWAGLGRGRVRGRFKVPEKVVFYGRLFRGRGGCAAAAKGDFRYEPAIGGVGVVGPVGIKAGETHDHLDRVEIERVIEVFGLGEGAVDVEDQERGFR